jgi:hypothetical protein
MQIQADHCGTDLHGRRVSCLFGIAILIWVGVWLQGSVCQAQTNFGQINGTVVDETGGVVVGATVTLTSLDIQAERKVTTSNIGAFVIPLVPPARYSVKVEKEGFRAFVVSEVKLQVNEARTLDVHLSVGAISQVVQVDAAAVAVNQTDATLGTVIQQQEIVEIPLNGRNFAQLVTLSPGVAPVVLGQQSTFSVTGGFSYPVNGLRHQMNNFTLDGVENNMRFTNTFADPPPPDAIAEFKVSSHQSDAAATLAAGANVNLVTRSGTNKFHGSVWEFIRNDKLAANGYFNNFFDRTKQPYKQNQFGFFLGGPVIIPGLMNGRSSRTYFSSYYEGLRFRQDTTGTAQVPDQAQRSGDFSGLLGAVIGTDCLGRPIQQGQLYDPFSTRADSNCPQGVIRDPYPNNIIPSSQISPIAVAYFDTFYPLPNRSGSPNLTYPLRTSRDGDQWGFRIDHNFSEKHLLFGRVNRYNTSKLAPAFFSLATPFEYLNTGINVASHYTYIHSSSLLFDFTGGYNRARTPWRSVALGSDWHSAVGDNFAIPLPDGFLPAGQRLGGSQFSFPEFFNYELANPDDQFQFSADIKKVISRHTMSFGFQLLRWRHHVGADGSAALNYSNQTTGLPEISGTGESIASFLVGLPTQTSFNLARPQTTHGNIYIGYVGDIWKATSKLSLNLGLQYIYAARPTGNRISAMDYPLALTQPLATDFSFAYLWASTNPITGASANASSGIIDADRNNFAPRVGLAYSFLKNTVIRAGFGIFYDFNTNLEQNSVRGNHYPFAETQNIGGQNLTSLGPANPIISLSNPYTPAVPSVAGLPGATIDPHLRDPYAMEWNFGIEQKLPGDILWSTNYVGSGGRKLTIETMENIAPAGPGAINPRRPFPNAPNTFWFIQNKGTSNYHSLQVTAERRFSKGLTFRNSYTFAKSLDLESDPNNGTDIDYTYDLRLSYGRSNWDIRHVNQTSFVYELPFGKGRKLASGVPGVVDQFIGGWRLSGIVTLHTGLPFYVLAGQDIENTGNGLGFLTEAAQMVSDPVPSGFKQDREHWFDASAFTLPAFGTIGNHRKNSLSGPGYQNFDISLAKDFRIKESLGLEFRSEFFNAFNHTNFGMPRNSLSNPSTLGQILNASAARDIQFALKLHW